MFKTIKTREPLSKRIVSEIETAIRDKKIPINGQLPSEKELCAQFNVSRTVLREALKELAGMELVTIKKGIGIFVKDISNESVSNHIERFLNLKFEENQIFEVHYLREILEPGIVETAALACSEEDLKKLSKNLEKFSNPRITPKEKAILDSEFHLIIAKATKNILLPIILEPIYNFMYQIRSEVYPAVKGAEQPAYFWHKKVFEAIKNRDVKLARQSIIKHLEISRKHTEEMLKFKLKNKN